MSYALVTGASAGIGWHLAEIFARGGHDLVLVARRREKLQELAKTLSTEHGRRVHVCTADLAQPGAAQHIYDDLQQEGLHIDYLVNNAGLGSNGPFIDLDPQRELDMVQVNISALVHLTRLLLPAMVQNKAGRVMNIASTAGFQPGPYMATYYATKAFVISFSEALAHEVADSGVTVTAHCPGATATEFAAAAGNDATKLFQNGQVASAQDVAEDAYRAMMAGERVAVHGLLNRIGAFSVRLSPRSLITSITAALNAKV